MGKNFTKRSGILSTLLTAVHLQNTSQLGEELTKVIQFQLFYLFWV